MSAPDSTAHYHALLQFRGRAPTRPAAAAAAAGLGRIVQAEEYLSQAQWTVLKSTHCSNATHSLLHRNLGLLYMAKENYEEARYHLANDIYFASCAFGTEDIRTSGGYFHLANIFYGLKKLDLADSLYTKVAEIWYKYLNDHYQVLSQARVQQIDLLGKQFVNDTGLDEAQEAEAIRVLTSVLNIRELTTEKAPQKTVFVLKTLVMLYYLMMNSSKASVPGKPACPKGRQEGLESSSAVFGPVLLASVLSEPRSCKCSDTRAIAHLLGAACIMDTGLSSSLQGGFPGLHRQLSLGSGRKPGGSRESWEE
uniref:Zinc finger MYND-type containing 12 n=1 Tax=Oryctolagus cuniculus TaxID=9986 RepID=A0A5F9DCK2_RABIT